MRPCARWLAGAVSEAMAAGLAFRLDAHAPWRGAAPDAPPIRSEPLVVGGRADVAIVGAGIVGLATARALLADDPSRRVVVVDKEPRVGVHQTSRSSGVVHRGVYYRPGSLKAELCVAGASALLAYCDERSIPVRRCGKVVVATGVEQLPRLEELHRRALANGVPDVVCVGPEELAELEPHVAGVGALWSPHTAVVDFGRVAEALAADLVAAGAELALGRRVERVRRVGGEVRLETSVGEVVARNAVVCAGVHADRLAVADGAPPGPRIVPFRGAYLRLRPARRHLSRGLVYPVPDPAFPFLGVHTTVRPDGDVWLGPNAVLAFAREGYRRREVSLRDLRDVVAAPGFRRLARRHWRTGGRELARDWSLHLFVREAQRLIPALEVQDVLPGPSGIRAQALADDGSLVDDFVIHERDGVVHVRNAPSPGATSCLAIGAWLAHRAAASFSR